VKDELLHVFRNDPTGRENLMQSAFFCDRLFGLSLAVWVPTSPRFVMRFEDGATMPVDLDSSYIKNPSTAAQRVDDILAKFKGKSRMYTPEDVPGSDFPVIPTDWSVMACPRVISEQSSRIGLGHIGPKVRGIVKHAPFPVFIPSTAYKPWTSVSVFFGGSAVGSIAVKEGIAIARLARVPMTIYTHLEGTSREACEEALAAADILHETKTGDSNWVFFSEGTFAENLYTVPYDSLVVVGAAGNRLMTWQPVSVTTTSSSILAAE